MIFTQTKLRDAWIITLAPIEDARGSFARSFCLHEFAARGIVLPVAQCSVSRSRRRGTLRGMHFQSAPHAEVKLVRCARGALWDVIVDLRHGSATGGQWFGTELSETNGRMVVVPEGFAHGFQTLTDDTTVDYSMSAPHVPGAASGVRWDDPAFGITWPIADPILSERDRAYPDWHGHTER